MCDRKHAGGLYHLTSTSGDAKEKFFNLVDMSAISDEQHHMVVSLNHGVMVGHDDFVAANNTTNTRTLWKYDFFDPMTDNARTTFVTVDNSLKRFGGTASQRVNLYHTKNAGYRLIFGDTRQILNLDAIV